MRTFAMTGMVTAFMMLSIIAGSLMRATPPCTRMSAGTRSSAITAQAPASSAIFACSGVTTPIITPPLSIWARPTFPAQVPVWGIFVPRGQRGADPVIEMQPVYRSRPQSGQRRLRPEWDPLLPPLFRLHHPPVGTHQPQLPGDILAQAWRGLADREEWPQGWHIHVDLRPVVLDGEEHGVRHLLRR